MNKVDERRSLARAAAASEPRGGGFRAVGAASAKFAAPIVEKRGGGPLARLKAAWPEIAGTDWAARAWPAALARDGALKLRVVPAAAIELQHRGPHLIDRINLFLGAACVTRLVLVQALAPEVAVAKAAPLRPLTAAEAAALEQTLCLIADPELRSALAGLGRAIVASRPAAAPVARGSETS